MLTFLAVVARRGKGSQASLSEPEFAKPVLGSTWAPLGATPLILLAASGLPPEQESPTLLGLLLRKGNRKTLLLTIN